MRYITGLKNKDLEELLEVKQDILEGWQVADFVDESLTEFTLDEIEDLIYLVKEGNC